MMKSLVQVGTKLPSGFQLHIGSPANAVDALQHLSKFKRAIVFGVPGGEHEHEYEVDIHSTHLYKYIRLAFTPGCSKTHLPGYIKDHDELQKNGVDYVACISVNEAFVMDVSSRTYVFISDT